MAANFNVHLKKTQVNDKSKPKITGVVSAEEIKQFENRFLDACIENWEPLLSGNNQGQEALTFKTRLVKLTPEEAYAIYQSCCFERKQEQPDPETLQRLKELEKRIQIAIDETLHDQSTRFVFAKLSSRSAKDVAIRSQKVRDEYLKALSKSQDQSDDHKARLLISSAISVFKFENAKEVLQVFSMSDRVKDDTLLAWERRNDRFQLSIAIRSWVDIDATMEFRGFVFQNKLTALSQYNHAFCFGSELINEKENLLHKITDFFEQKVKPRLSSFGNGDRSYVCDFAIDETGRMWVIELNPFAESCDAALFSWRYDSDILRGEKPFEFRLREKPFADIRHLFEESWRFFFDLKP